MLRTLIATAILAGLTLPASSYYRIYAHSDVGGFLMSGTNYDFDQTDGQKSYVGHAAATGDGGTATSNESASFGLIGASSTSIGPYASGKLDTFTDDTLHFTNPTGLPMQVRFDLIVVGQVIAPPPAYVAIVQSFILLGDPSNPFARVDYLRKYNSGILTQSVDPVSAFAMVNSGSSFNLRHRFNLQQSSLNSNLRLACNYTKGARVLVTVLTPGAGFTADSGKKYSPTDFVVGLKP